MVMGNHSNYLTLNSDVMKIVKSFRNFKNQVGLDGYNVNAIYAITLTRE